MITLMEGNDLYTKYTYFNNIINLDLLSALLALWSICVRSINISALNKASGAGSEL